MQDRRAIRLNEAVLLRLGTLVCRVQEAMPDEGPMFVMRGWSASFKGQIAVVHAK
jgi:hypothetical protein